MYYSPPLFITNTNCYLIILHPTFKTDYMRDQEWQDDWIEEQVSGPTQSCLHACPLFCRALFLLCSMQKAQYVPRNQAPRNAPPKSNIEKLYDFDRYQKQKHTMTAMSDTIDQLESYTASRGPLTPWVKAEERVIACFVDSAANQLC
ncbi:hypothetical protein BOTBODRAFT_116029 [Botryobasidium botryosum FD-172 SS1]|uniref:Uncharacterized protein n=1 Tax=Botryobasidium botryosum (strain FD-172 SS1) TaxID=930990 RepID=A0A067M420_BOTB1|nr:hypothetical protein BOTBODRAFT_116029 [Botryobasidium botryosum FD-172 SS1]